MKVVTIAGNGDGGAIVEGANGVTDLTFTPQSGQTYYIEVQLQNTAASGITFDKVDYSQSSDPTEVRVRLWNQTDGNATGLPIKTVDITNTASALIATLNFNATAAKAYRVRVRYNDGSQRPIVDESTATVNTTTAAPFAAMELGLDGKVWALSNPSGGDPAAFTYDFTNEDWDVANATVAAAGTGSVVRALAHSDAYEYALMSGGEVIQFNESGDNDYTAAHTDPTGMAICQDRLFVLTEDDSGTNGVDVTTYAVDADVSGGVTASLQTVSVSTAIVAADTTLRERMCATPTGARFFVNYSSVTSVIYEADSSGSTLVVRELCRLDEGTKATAIAHVRGQTFVATQSLAETGSVRRCQLQVIDATNTPRVIGSFRREDPTDAAVTSLQPYQSDMWMLQGKFIWRFDLKTGGLYLEYELEPGDQSYARQIAVVQDHVFALFAQEDSTNTGGVVWVAGSVGTYRQSSIADGSSLTTSVFDYGLPGFIKTLRSVQVMTDDLPTGASVTIEVQVDQDGTFVPIGTHSSGSQATFIVSNSEATTEFKTLQVRVKLNSAGGTTTPVVKAVIVEALALEFEEFFDLIIRTEDEDVPDHVQDQTLKGGDFTQKLWALRRSRSPLTFVDAYEHPDLDNNPTYLVVFDTSDVSNDDIGEGRMSVRLRVIS
jgi:hypothetical protein